MAAPTQQYPSWLTPIPTVVTDVDGALTTSTTIMFLPLTYYGPSIPLDSDWTYGGLSSPASTSTPSTTSAIPSITSSATPTITSFTTTSSLSVSSTTALSTTLSVTSASSSSTAAVPTVAPNPTGGSRLTKGQLVGVIVASVLGFIFLLVLIFAAYLFFKGKRRRSGANDRNLGTDYAVVPREGGAREPGEGSPRHSGEEGDSFLRPSAYARNARGKGKARAGQATYAEVGVKPPVPPKGARIPAPPGTSGLGSSSSSRGTSSNPSQNSKPSVGSSKTEYYGTLLAEGDPSRIENRIGPIREDHEHGMSGGAILTPEQMDQINDESVLPPGNGDGEYTGAYAYSLLPPPRLVDPAARSSDSPVPRPPFVERPSESHRSSSVPPDADEKVTLMTAKRVRIEDLGPRTASTSSPVDETDTSRASTSFLGAIANRLTWRRSQSPRSSQHQQRPLLESTPLSDSDIEHGRLRPLPAIPPMTEVARTRAGPSTLGLGPDGSRPISSVSGKSQNSGGTIYHDAVSSQPASPSPSPLPRAATPSDGTTGHTPPPSIGPSGFQHRPSVPSQLGRSSPSTSSPQQQTTHSQTRSQAAPSFGQTLASSIDILDMPAPSALSSFGSSSSDATIINGAKSNIFQPRLAVIPTPKSWADLSSTGTIPSPGSFGGDQDNGVGIGITIDVLEEEPPTAGEGWKSIASTSGVGGSGEQHGRRTTFGLPQYVHQQDLTSEQASLYSMRSHLTTSPPRSTGSAAASRRDLSYGSNSSRPSARSASDGSSNLLSFARSGSINSEERKLGLAHGGQISPALSAFNSHHARSGSGSGSGCEGVAFSRDGSSSGNASAGHGYGYELGVINEDVGLQSPDVAHLAPARVGSESGSAMSSPPMSPLGMPWAGGLDETWSPSS